MIDIKEIVNLVEEGHYSPLKALAEFKCLAKEVSDGISAIEDFAHVEAENYGEKSFKDFGFSFEVRPGRKTYDFSRINEWSSIKSKLKEKEALYKMAAASYDKGTRVFDEESGEQIPIPLVKYSKPSMVIKILDDSNEISRG